MYQVIELCCDASGNVRERTVRKNLKPGKAKDLAASLNAKQDNVVEGDLKSYIAKPS
jgi:hypothetical protein